MIALTYNLNNTSRDRRWSVPDQVDATEALSCAFSTDVTSMKSIADYQSSLVQSIAAHVGVSENLWLSAFSANLQYQQVNSEFGTFNSSSANVFVSSGSTCQTYQASFRPFQSLNVTDSFRSGVTQMPTSFSSQTASWFESFFQAFGTSYATSIDMGASAAFQYELTTASYSNLRAGGVDISSGASISFLANFGFDASSSSHYQDFKAFSSAVSSTLSVGIGAAPPVTSNLSDWAAWQQQVSATNQDSSPFPIQYALTSLAMLFTSDIFPLDAEIKQKQAALTLALDHYCGQIVKNCGPPPPPANKTIGWKMFGFDHFHSHQSPYQGPKSNNLLWKFATNDIIRASPSFGSDGTIYVCSGDQNVYALNASGNLKWKFLTGTPISSSPAIGADGTIYIGAGNLYAITPTGEKKWILSGITFDTWSDPVISPDGTIYVAGGAGVCFGIDASGSIKWTYKAGGGCFSSPVIGANGIIYFSCVGTLFAIDTVGNLKWAYQANGTTLIDVYESPAIGLDGTIFWAQLGYLFAIDPSGNMKWKFGGWSMSSSVAVGSAGVIYVSGDENVYAIDQAGTLKWKFSGDAACGSPTLGADKTVYVGCGNMLHAIDETGSVIWTFSTNFKGYEYIRGLSIGPDGSLVFGSFSHYIYSIMDQ